MNRKNARTFCLLFFVATMFSCSRESDRLKPKMGLQYFDLADFMKQETKCLSVEKTEVSKSVYLNGKKEQRKMFIEKWDNELSAFSEADINKKSFLEKYSVDSLFKDNYLTVKYSAKENNLHTREMVVTYCRSTPVEIKATVATDNTLYSSHQNIVYKPEVGYWISGSQAIRFLKPDTFSVSAIFQH